MIIYLLNDFIKVIWNPELIKIKFVKENKSLNHIKKLYINYIYYINLLYNKLNMSFLCKVCDRWNIENESEYNKYLATLRKENDKSLY